MPLMEASEVFEASGTCLAKMSTALQAITPNVLRTGRQLEWHWVKPRMQPSANAGKSARQRMPDIS